MNNENPYSYGGPVTAPHFAGREVELAALVSRMKNGISVAVTGPRRYGKTSLIGRGVEEFEKAGGAVISVNLMRCPSLDALARRLTTGAFELKGAKWRRARQAVPEFLTRVRVKPTVTFSDDGKPVFRFGELGLTDAGRVVDDVYSMLADLPSAVLVMDEFHAISDLGSGLAGVLKSLGDEYPKVSLVMASSKRHLMEALVLSKGAPLYNMAERLALGPIDPPALTRYLQERATAGKKPMSLAAAAEICELAGPVPYDIQRLAYETFDTSTNRIAEVDVCRGLRNVVDHEAPDFSDRMATFTLGQRRVMAAIATYDQGVTQPNSASFAREVGYATAAGTRRAIKALKEEDLLAERFSLTNSREGSVVIADPFFAQWLRENY